jgi:hypothetical protein
MGVKELKHSALLQEWGEKIMESGNSFSVSSAYETVTRLKSNENNNIRISDLLMTKQPPFPPL